MKFENERQADLARHDDRLARLLAADRSKFQRARFSEAKGLALDFPRSNVVDDDPDYDSSDTPGSAD